LQAPGTVSPIPGGPVLKGSGDPIAVSLDAILGARVIATIASLAKVRRGGPPTRTGGVDERASVRWRSARRR